MEKNSSSIIIGDWNISLDEKSHPKEIMVEVTTRCNYDCIYCFRRTIVGEGFHDMDRDLFYKIIDEAVEIGVSKISFSGWGEPLIHPYIIDFLYYAKSKGLEILLNTNGYFLIKYVDYIARIGVDDIIVSIDAAEDDVYKLIRRGGDLARVIEALLILKDMKIKKNMFYPRVNIQFTINRYNYRNLLATTKLAHTLGASKIIVSNVIPLNQYYEENVSCYSDPKCLEEVSKITEELARIELEYGVEISLPNFNKAYSERICPFISKYALFIRYDGGVAPCIYYAHHWKNYLAGVQREIKPVIFGYVGKEKLINIWRKPEYIRFRAITYFMHQPSCLDCPLQPYCTITLTNEYDCWGNSPTCAHCPYSRDMTRCPL
ncbi:Radical SAM domain protein [Staphylothermus marinus F1]|uniref:Radical SAM domain protein n=1 Tax=Staphylothermus marinus (strain ATCC 43588 / DSM 3639 / JCM 9404 / F1) TaxID=399550 RepID=A3DMB3_STAMF|nr:tungsten cofactor oxidoreductase radical SAM maturase [Staphylothermus marinus]ABN69773.1 Radical SAM domain protein [Staphylothermus marinus F1]